MFIPANFAIGALVGAAASYIYKDEAAKETLSNLGSKVKGGFDSTLGLLKKKPEAEVVEEAISAESVVADDAVVAEQDVAEAVPEEADVITEEKSDKA